MHSHSERSSPVIHCSHYFEKGEIITTFSLYGNKSNLVKYGERMLKISGAQIWNNITSEIQESTSIGIFKDEVKKFFLNEYDS